MVRGALVATAAFVVMEPVAYAAHRWVMHGPGRPLHDSHHRPGLEGRQSLEANDLYPVVFAAATVGAMAVGARGGRASMLLPAGAGVTAYGLAYAFVHDVYIHRRLGQVPAAGVMERLRRAHACHHRDGGEPYGMLFPILSTSRLRPDEPSSPEASGRDSTPAAGRTRLAQTSRRDSTPPAGSKRAKIRRPRAPTAWGPSAPRAVTRAASGAPTLEG